MKKMNLVPFPGKLPSTATESSALADSPLLIFPYLTDAGTLGKSQTGPRLRTLSPDSGGAMDSDAICDILPV